VIRRVPFVEVVRVACQEDRACEAASPRAPALVGEAERELERPCHEPRQVELAHDDDDHRPTLRAGVLEPPLQLGP
jgi:hypothetical protein